MTGRGSGHRQLTNQHIEVIDQQLATFGQILQQTGACGTHLLEGHVGGGQGAGLLQDVPQTAGIYSQDAGVAGHQGIAHVAQEPGQVADGFLHPLGAVATNRNRAEAGGQHHSHIGIAASAVQQTAKQIALANGALGEGLHRLLEGQLIGRQRRGIGCAGGLQGAIEIGERRAASEDAVGRTGHDEFRIGTDATGHLDPQLATLEKIEQVAEFAPIGETILLHGLTDAGERQGVVALGRNPRAAAAGGHGH